jgi:hypothetical protein
MSALSPKIDLKISFLVEFEGILCVKMAQICLRKKTLGNQLIGTNFEGDNHARFSLSFDWWVQTQSKELKALK